MDEIKLDACPFCGSTKLKVEKKSRPFGITGLDVPVNNVSCSVRCNRCYARGPIASGRVLAYSIRGLPQPSWSATISELNEQAKTMWNQRAK